MGRRVVGITGLFGAWLSQVSTYLENAGGSILWPGQDLQLADTESKYEANGENSELLRIHQSILEQCDLGWFTKRRPRFFDVPYPGPQEYLSKFPVDEDVILVDGKLCFFLPLWKDYLTDLVIVEVSADEIEDVLRVSVPHTTRGERQAVVDNYSKSLQGDVGLIEKVWYIKNGSLKGNSPTFEFVSTKDKADLNSGIYAKEGM